MNSSLRSTFIPELGTVTRGKVRDLYNCETNLLMIATDRLSVYDRVLNECIRDKGKILNALARYWFEHTHDCAPNHFIDLPDPNVMIVKKCTPLPVEVIVRNYLSGSMWRDYANGIRDKCGVPLPDGLTQNAQLPFPIITPTTKSSEGHDEDISPEELINRDILTSEQWKQIEIYAFKLFEKGTSLLNSKGLTLVDTKYEFGLDEKEDILLIDEIHTPDSSRFWFQKEADKRFPDKEFAREWAKSQSFTGDGPLPSIPVDIQDKIRQGYLEIYQAVTGENLASDPAPIENRLLSNLKKFELIKGVFVLVLATSENDPVTIKQTLKILGIPCEIIVDPTENMMESITAYNNSMEPMACVITKDVNSSLCDKIRYELKWPTLSMINGKDVSIAAINALQTMELSV